MLAAIFNVKIYESGIFLLILLLIILYIIICNVYVVDVITNVGNRFNT